MHGCVNMQISNQNIAAICAKEGFDWIFWRIFVFFMRKAALRSILFRKPFWINLRESGRRVVLNSKKIDKKYPE